MEFTPPALDYSPWASRVWPRLRIRLVNTRNAFAREPPAFIFWAVLKHAARGIQVAGQPIRYVFHCPEGRFGARMRKDSVWSLEIPFDHGGEGEAEQFLRQLGQHLQRAENNFILEAAELDVRSLADLLAETRLDVNSPLREVCLDFTTPFAFAHQQEKRRWLLNAAGLWGYLWMRVRQVMGGAAGDAPACPAIRPLPYYWEFAQYRHKAKSNPGDMILQGCQGPLYLRGDDLRPLLPLLALCSEFHVHPRNGGCGGHYRLHGRYPWFDALLGNPTLYRSAFERWCRDSDHADDAALLALDRASLGDELADAFRAGTYVPEPAEVFSISKADGGSREIAMIKPRDRVVQESVQQALGPVFDRMFEDSSMAYRAGRSIHTARSAVTAAIEAGCTHVLETDVEAFFDEVDWDLLDGKLDDVLPCADVLTRRLIATIVRMPAERRGVSRARNRGLLQGSVISPLLANLFLDSLDEDLASRGYRLVRYADDFVVLTASEQEARDCLVVVQELIGRLRLRLNIEKTAIRTISEGFTFVGFDWGGEWKDEVIERSAMRKPLYVVEPYGCVGIDGDTLEVRRDGRLLHRFPLARIGEVTILGPKVVTTRLLERCSRQGIAVTVAGPTGSQACTYLPRSRAHFSLAARHHARMAAAGHEGTVAAARRLVEAKILNYLFWLRHARVEGMAEDAPRLMALLHNLPGARTVEEVRGYEGAAAKLTFAAVNRRIQVEAFRSERRIPHERPDRLNGLLDFGYYLLFNRLNVLVRGAGLDPFLGFLHSPGAPFESLVCDMQEPFRARIDRLVVRMINRSEIKPEQMVPAADGRWSMDRPAFLTYLSAFERDQATQLAGEVAAFRDLLRAQVFALKEWVERGDWFRVYRSGPAADFSNSHPGDGGKCETPAASSEIPSDEKGV